MCIRDREAPREAQRLLRLAVRQGGLRLPPIRSRGEGRLALWRALGPRPPRAGVWAPSLP
eukprot:13151491-Alexandrium_andersonii.AAC.1